MGRNYNRSIFKHLEETLAKFDALEREFNTYKQKAEQELFECRAKIAGTALGSDESATLKESVEQQKQREQLEKQIAALEAKIRKEKQPRMKFELVSELKQLQEDARKMGGL